MLTATSLLPFVDYFNFKANILGEGIDNSEIAKAIKTLKPDIMSNV
jgi:hypothetical protein